MAAAPLQSKTPVSSLGHVLNPRPDSLVPIEAAGSGPGRAPQSVNLQDEVSAPSAPKLLHKVNPAYPADAKADKAEGVFLVGVVVGKDGAIKEAQVVVSAPSAEQLEQIKAKRGTPAGLRDGQPVEFRATVTINFSLS